MEAVDFRIWKKRKTAGKTAAFDPAFGRNPVGGGRFPGSWNQKDPEIGTGAGQEETETEGGEATEQQYERLLEKRVEDTLECVEGVGKVKVMLTLKSSEEKVVEKDSQREENEITEEDSKGGSRVSEDRSLSHTSIYEQKSDGTQTPYVRRKWRRRLREW